MKAEKPKEEGAPAYMAQYTALMTILLAFFICMLTMGNQAAAEYKRQGYGYIRDAFGVKGGMGILPYLKAVMKRHPHPEAPPTDNADLLGYEKGAFEATRLSDDGIGQCELANVSRMVRISTPVMFEAGRWDLDLAARSFLKGIGRVFYDRPDVVLTACCLETSGGDATDRQRIASTRSAVVVRYLEEECGIPRARLRSLGYAHDRYLAAGDREPATGVTQALMFVVRKQSPPRRGS